MEKAFKDYIEKYLRGDEREQETESLKQLFAFEIREFKISQKQSAEYAGKELKKLNLLIDMVQREILNYLANEKKVFIDNRVIQRKLRNVEASEHFEEPEIEDKVINLPEIFESEDKVEPANIGIHDIVKVEDVTDEMEDNLTIAYHEMGKLLAILNKRQKEKDFLDTVPEESFDALQWDTIGLCNKLDIYLKKYFII